MAQPLKIDRPHKKTLKLPTSLVSRVDLLLFSETENRVPQGAWQKYISELIRQDFLRRGYTL